MPVFGACPEDRSVCPFYGAVVLGRQLGSDPLSWVVGQTEDPLRESLIPGCNVGELTLLISNSSSRLYVIKPKITWLTMQEITHKKTKRFLGTRSEADISISAGSSQRSPMSLALLPPCWGNLRTSIYFLTVLQFCYLV